MHTCKQDLNMILMNLLTKQRLRHPWLRRLLHRASHKLAIGPKSLQVHAESYPLESVQPLLGSLPSKLPNLSTVVPSTKTQLHRHCSQTLWTKRHRNFHCATRAHGLKTHAFGAVHSLTDRTTFRAQYTNHGKPVTLYTVKNAHQ